jgi:ubiquinone/menaquinone biosynthesis C-methylase UbiE
MRVLDVGCGTGNPPVRARLSQDDHTVGIDLSLQSLRTATRNYPERHFLCGRAESLPFCGSSFERVVSSVAIPYTNIPSALKEIKRVLAPGGSLFLSVHHFRFTLGELYDAIPNPKAVLFRLYVLANGLVFHFTGRTMSCGNGRFESFQTMRGLKLALRRAGFGDISFSRPDGRLIVEARSL